MDSPPLGPRVRALKAYLDPIVDRFERLSFIDGDPISIPRGFDDPADREVIGLFSALLAWGRRDLMLRKLEELCERMRYRPRAFIADFDSDRGEHRLHGFVHRTFNSTDAIWLCKALKEVLRGHGSIEKLCSGYVGEDAIHAAPAIEGLSGTLLNVQAGMPVRMRKHLPRPSTGSACKRLNLYFRWMVRPGPVDMSVWKTIRPRQLLLPLDVHSGRQARAIGLLARKANDWKATMELTNNCRRMCAEDPARYDFALFGTGEAGEMLLLE